MAGCLRLHVLYVLCYVNVWACGGWKVSVIKGEWREVMVLLAGRVLRVAGSRGVSRVLGLACFDVHYQIHIFVIGDSTFLR